MNADTIEQRSADATSIAHDLRERVGAFFRLIAKVPAMAGIRRGDEYKC